jgi:hypothetical protein
MTELEPEAEATGGSVEKSDYLDGTIIEIIPKRITREELKNRIVAIVSRWEAQNPNACLGDGEQIQYYLSRKVARRTIYELLVELGKEERLFVEKYSYLPPGKKKLAKNPMSYFLVGASFWGEHGYFERTVRVLDDNFFRDSSGRLLKISID